MALASRTKRIVIAVAAASLVLGGVSPALADTFVPVDGSGSSSQNVVLNQWTSEVAQDGMDVNYAGTGSNAGMALFAAGITDFAVSDEPYGLTDDGVVDPVPSRPLTYVPFDVGAITFPYHLTIDGTAMTGLRFSGLTIAEIFTGVITRWNDPRIEADNPGIPFPALQITPVVRADATDTTDELTEWIATEYPTLWTNYCVSTGRSSADCGMTSEYPVSPGSDFISQSLESGVDGYVAQSTSDGAITYSQVGDALEGSLPTPKLLNDAGYYTAPTAGADLIALTDVNVVPGQIADLTSAYTNPDPRAYPLATVSYLIVPTSTADSFTMDKGLTLSSFAEYGLCDGQQPLAQLGAAPLPPALDQDGLDSLSQIPGMIAEPAGGGTDPMDCGTLATGIIASTPQPSSCDYIGNPFCAEPPGSVDGSETITTSLPPGELVISVAQNPNVVLPSPQLDTAGDLFLTSGAMSPLTVTDNRSGNLGWTVTGQITDFTDGAGSTIDGQNLGWSPSVVSLGPAQTVVLGPVVAPTVGGGLKSPQVLAIGTGLGTTNLGATLNLDVPTTTLPGTYSATLTLTAI